MLACSNAIYSSMCVRTNLRWYVRRALALALARCCSVGDACGCGDGDGDDATRGVDDGDDSRAKGDGSASIETARSVVGCCSWRGMASEAPGELNELVGPFTNSTRLARGNDLDVVWKPGDPHQKNVPNPSLVVFTAL